MPPTIPGKVHVSKRGRLNLPEVALAPGPAAEAVTGDGSLADLYGYAWALVWDDLRDPLVLYREDAGAWVEQAPLAPLPELTKPARHVSLAFDRSARPMIAWQAEDGIRVRQWSVDLSTYVVRGPFAGHDPVLLFDGLPRLNVGGSDVMLFHLSSDRSTVVARLERNEYADVYDVATLGRSDLFLDQAVRLPYRVRLELANDTPSGGALDRVRLLSDLYPIVVDDALSLAPGTATGRYEATTAVELVDPSAVTLAPGTATGRYEATTAVVVTDDALSLAPAIETGRYEATTAVELVDPSAVTLAPSGATGAYTLTTVVETVGPDSVEVVPTVGTGRYERI